MDFAQSFPIIMRIAAGKMCVCVCVCLSILVQLAMRLQLLYRLLATFSWILIRGFENKASFFSYGCFEGCLFRIVRSKISSHYASVRTRKRGI